MPLARLPKGKGHAARQCVATCAGDTSKSEEGNLISVHSYRAIFPFPLFPLCQWGHTSFLLSCCIMSTATIVLLYFAILDVIYIPVLCLLSRIGRRKRPSKSYHMKAIVNQRISVWYVRPNARSPRYQSGVIGTLNPSWTSQVRNTSMTDLALFKRPLIILPRITAADFSDVLLWMLPKHSPKVSLRIAVECTLPMAVQCKHQPRGLPFMVLKTTSMASCRTSCIA